MQSRFGDVGVEMQDHVAIVEIQRPPLNFFDVALITALADAFDALDAEPQCRALVLAAQGKAFCAGADFKATSQKEETGAEQLGSDGMGRLYTQAVRLFAAQKPVIGAIHGAAVGGGLGLALVPDFRVTCAEGRFAANFTALGIHPGFGLTHTLPRLIGQQRAALMFQTGRRIQGETAYEWGLADVFTTLEDVRPAAIRLAAEIGENAPLAVMSTRATLRDGLAQAVARQTERELAEQTRLMTTEDHAEGVRAVAERRKGAFKGR